MLGELILAVDLGTSFIKTGVYDTSGNILANASEPVKDERLRPGIYIQKAELILEAVLNCIKAVTESIGDKSDFIEAIVFTGQMAGFMGVDKNWGDVTHWSCSLDNRYLKYADSMTKEYADLFLEQAGTNSPVMLPKIHWFANDFSELSKTISKYMMISGFILGRLGDVPIEDATIDRTYLEWTGLSDIKNSQWSKEILDLFSIDEDKLPRIVESSTICGKLSQKMAEILGLKSGIPLISGAGDKPAGCLGAAIVDCGDTIFEAASYGGMSCCVDEYRPDYKNRRLDIIPSAIPGMFYSHYYAAGSGITIDWFAKNFTNFGDLKEKEIFSELEKLAENVSPGCDGLMAIGMLGGCAMPLKPKMRGLWSGFNWSHKPEHFYRALLESFAYEFAMTTDTYDELYKEYAGAPVNIIGGGSKSAFWTQMHSDVSGRNYQLLSRSDVALWGACIIAGKAIGIFDDMKETAKKHVSVTKVYNPNSEMNDFYRKKMQEYKELLKYSEPIFEITAL